LDCCLWLNRKKISNAAEIIDNFDLAAVRGYFLGGSLSEWLREHGGTVYADRLDKLRTLDPQDPQLNDRLAEVFGVSAGAVTEVFCGNVPDNGACAGNNGGSRCGSFGSFSGGFRGSSGSFNFGSYGVFQGSGLGIGSGGLTALGSYRFSLWEWEWEWRFAGRGSFRGSFGSYRFGSGSYLLGSFGSFPWGSFSGSFGAGSFGGFGSGGSITADEYDRIMYECLRKCPLNCYGYGIHIV
jgi:hypothetical protein